MQPFYLSHIALIVASLEASRARLECLSPRFAEVEDRPRERTRELYVGLEFAASLLLCQPIDSEGPYARALARRGPGLHHIGLSVPSLDAYVANLAGSGWYVLPQSLRTVARGVIWLARPGVKTLVEICQMEETPGSPFVSSLEIAMSTAKQSLVDRLGLPDRPLAGVTVSSDQESWLTIGKERLSAFELARA
jgi:hypothetical protein